MMPEAAIADVHPETWRRTSDRPATRPRHSRALRHVRAIAEALFSTAEGPAPSNRIFWLERELSSLLQKAGPRSAFVYTLGVFLVSWLAPLFMVRAGPLWRLPLAGRVEALRRMERSFLSTVMLGVKAILCVLYYEHADSAREAGYRGACAEGGGR